MGEELPDGSGPPEQDNTLYDTSTSDPASTEAPPSNPQDSQDPPPTCQTPDVSPRVFNYRVVLLSTT